MRVEDELEPIAFDAIDGFERDDLAGAFCVFRRSAARIAAGGGEQRPARDPGAGLIAASRAALSAEVEPAAFFQRWFRPFRFRRSGFVTAYYEAEAEARLEPERGFAVPVLARPPDLVTLNEAPITGPGGESLTSARLKTDGALEPYPDRREIEDDPAFDRGVPLAYVRDPVELFLMQVQGSARLRLADGSALSLTYDGRNGHPYTSIGRLMIERGLVSPEAMSLETLKAALRALGQAPGQPGRLLMQENQSYVFFRIDASDERRAGPIGGEGLALTPLRSIAVDRSLWSYGLPFWISALLPWRGETETEFDRLMIAQDTGSAIVGPARADLFLGAGERAGRLAGLVRHAADFTVLLPSNDGGGR
jgi:membrane-bound lytic murein transglycosylase A